MYNEEFENQAQEIDLYYVYQCDKCGKETEYPYNFNPPEECYCGGYFNKTGESYNA